MRQDRRQSGGSRIALADGVGGDQPKDAARPQQAKSAVEKVGDEVGIAVSVRMQRLQPRQIVVAVASDDRVVKL